MAKGVFTFICKQSGKNWTAKQRSGDIEDSAPTTYELERKLVKAAVAADSSGAAVRSSFSMITPKSAIFQVIIGGATFVGGGVAAAASAPPPAAAGGAAKAAPAEEKKKEEEAEESDGDLGFSLFD